MTVAFQGDPTTTNWPGVAIRVEEEGVDAPNVVQTDADGNEYWFYLVHKHGVDVKKGFYEVVDGVRKYVND